MPVYHLQEDVIEIWRVLHSSQQWPQSQPPLQ